MTLIGAKHIDWQWNLFADDWVTMWKQTVSAKKYFRKKIKILDRTDWIVVASCWSCDEADYIQNEIDRALCDKNLFISHMIDDTITKTLADARKDIKEVYWDDIKLWWYCFLLLDVIRDELYRITELWVLKIDKDVEIVEGSGATAFYELQDRDNFIDRFMTAVEADEYCKPPIIFWGEWWFWCIEQHTVESTVTKVNKKKKK